MSIESTVQNPELEYRATMQLAALGFIRRHQAEHLGDDQRLCTRAVNHLHSVLEVPVYLAETLTGLAYGELRSTGDHCRLDLNSSSESVAVFTEPLSGKSFAVPVALIFPHLIDALEQRQLPTTN